MRITVVALGTRGDVQPAIALALGLRQRGHTVQIMAGENFQTWIESYGLTFCATLDMEALMRSPEGIAWVEEPNAFKQLTHMKGIMARHGATLLATMNTIAAESDLLISGFVGAPYVAALSEQYRIPHINVSLQPWRPTQMGESALGAITARRKSIFNLYYGKIAQRLIWNVASETANPLRITLGLRPYSPIEGMAMMARIPIVFAFSQRVVPRASDWDAHVQVSGYLFLDEAAGYQPSAALHAFLNAGAPPVYFGFGSMASSDPGATVRLIVEALRQTGQRGIIASGWSGAQAESLPEHVFLLDKAPHDWLFERVCAVIHHGGAGTTAAGLRAGKPTMIIPHMSDQPFWGRRVHELGVGAKSIPRPKLTMAGLAAGIQTITRDEGIKTRAAALGAQIRAEDGIGMTLDMIERML